MKICPFIFREVVTREVKVDEGGKVLEEKEAPSVREGECRRLDCELYDDVAERCVLPLLSQVTSPKLEKGLQSIAEGQREEKDILSELGKGFGDLREALARASESSQETLKVALAEAEKSKSSVQEQVSGLKESLSEISQALSKVSETGSKEIELLEGFSGRLFQELPSAIEASGEKMTGGLSQVSERFEELLDLSRKRSESVVSSVEEISRILSDLRDLPSSIQSAGDRTAEGLSEASGRLGELLELGRERGGRILDSVGEISKAVSELRELPSSIQLSREKMVEGLSRVSGNLEELLELDRQGGEKTIGSMEEISRAISQVGGLLEGELALVRDVDKRLSEAVTAVESFVELEKERGDKMEEVVRGIGESTCKIGEFLQEEKERREEEKKREKVRSAREHNDRGVSLYYRGLVPAAAKEFEKALELNPEDAATYNNLALSLTKLDRPEEAISSFKKAIELNPEFAEAYSNLGLVYYEKGDYEEAVDLFSQALEKHENYASAYVNLGNALHQQNRYEEATKSWEKALEIDPGCEEARRAIELLKEGRIDGGHHQED